jgi:hypothetical protein
MIRKLSRKLIPLSFRDKWRPLLFLAHDLKVSVWRVQGPTRRGEASVLTADAECELNPLVRRFFTGPVDRVPLGKVPVWRLASFLRKFESGSDLTLVHFDKIAARVAFRCGFLDKPDWLCVPDWIGATMDVPEDVNALGRLSSSVKDDLRKVRKQGWETTESHLDPDFENFYTTMYLPLMAARHGEDATPRRHDDLHEQFLRGHLIWISEGGSKLAGAVVERTGDTLHFVAVGTRGGDESLVRLGALAALYVSAIQHAKAEGCKNLNFGGCHGWMNDGLLAYKRKWGMKLGVQPHHRKCTLLRWNRWTEAVGEFLEETSVLHEEGNSLTAIAATGAVDGADSAEMRRLDKLVRMPGIGHVVLFSPHGWLPDVVAPAGAVLASGNLSARDLISPPSRNPVVVHYRINAIPSIL